MVNKRIKLNIIAIISLALTITCSATYFLSSYLNSKQLSPAPVERTIAVEEREIDYQSVLEEFDNAELEKSGDVTSFTGTKTIKVADLLEVDNLAASDVQKEDESTVKYHFTYNKETNIVTMSAELINENGEIYIDEITGAGFINSNNQIDAVMNVDGESILLSEMANAYQINNCGWFSKLVKKVVKVAVVAVVATAVVAASVAVAVATAGAAAPALVAAGVGIASSTAVTCAAGAAGLTAGLLFCSTVGVAALQAGTAIAEPLAEGAEQLVDKATGAILSILVKGVEYVMVAVTSAVIYELAKNSYFIAAIAKDGLVYISKTPIDRVLATWAVRMELSIYTFYSENAYQVAKDASDGGLPVYDPAHLYKNGVMQKGIFFDHWHKYNHMGRSHCLFGVPYINIV